MNSLTMIPDTRPQPILQAAGIPHDPAFGPVTPVWYGQAMYVEVRGSRTGVDLDLVVYARNRMGQFRPQTRLTPDVVITTHAGALAWVHGWLGDLNAEAAA